MSSRLTILLSTSALLFWASCQYQDDISYSRDIKPLLNKKCLRCHGGIRALGGFSLLFEHLATAPTESGKLAIVAGRPGASEMIRRIKETDPELIMPQEGTPLTKQEIELLETWIQQGAEFDEHWSYRALTVPTPPPVETSDWVQNPIDQYILAEMGEQGLRPSPKAEPNTLARRLSFDLTGLPAIPGNSRQNLSTLSIKQVEQYVDTLLRTPHYGEHFAAMWLDLARYADSNGYEKDGNRSIWRYRDWVINALNDDMPFDQFTITQLAGDLLAEPAQEDLIATAFHRNTMTNTEGGTEDEEYRVTSVMDRVNTTFELWQGTTISCVQCHAHPYDPFTHKEYYNLVAIFNNTQDADIDSEYPYLIEISDTLQEKMREVASWIKNLDDTYEIPKGDFTQNEIQRLVYPRFFGDFADDFQDVLISSDGRFNNSAYNANNQKHKKYYLVYKDVDLDEINAIKYHYTCNGDDAVIHLYLDDLRGNPVASTIMVAPKKDGDWIWKTEELPDLSGQHDLIFHIENSSGDFRTGVVNFKEIQLEQSGKKISNKLRHHQDSLLSLYRMGIKTPILKERSDPLNRSSYVFERGNYLVRGDVVTSGVPKILQKDTLPVLDRLDLARWLVSDQNPLTARVMVNRIWAYIFGEGLVSTPEDFGTQGEPSSHPALLDYLAYEFSHSWHWSIKTLVRNIVLSATYQQSSDVDSVKMQIDPLNKWYSRGNRFRLSAEQIRDQALVVSGLFNEKVGGQSVMPAQPHGVWQVVYSSERWDTSASEDNYRRGLYTFWKRTAPYPSMTAFDSPSREFCVSRRIRTNTPLQALVTLNDTVYLEAAAALGLYMENQSHNGDVMQAIRAGYQRAIRKDPDEEALTILKALYEKAALPREKLMDDSSKDQDLLKPYTVVANTILNLDALLTKS